MVSCLTHHQLKNEQTYSLYPLLRLVPQNNQFQLLFISSRPKIHSFHMLKNYNLKTYTNETLLHLHWCFKKRLPASQHCLLPY